MTFQMKVYDVLTPRGFTSFVEARSNTEAMNLAHAEYRQRAHEIRRRADREWAWTKREMKQRKTFVLHELAELMVNVGRVG